ncbi:MAG: carboxypeptidase-like regulatory domain-containing protein [Croceivirga sp.]
MIKTTIYLVLCLVISFYGFAQKNNNDKWQAGFTTIDLLDTTRLYKPDANVQDGLYYRPIDLDVWYPSLEFVDAKEPLRFRGLFQLYEDRANKYQEETDYSGITNELAQFYVAELGIGIDGLKLLDITTDSYGDATPAKEEFPLIVYMAGFNGMGFENYKVLEQLAQNGFVVVSISSVGRYPGDMTNEKEDMLAQVNDAEFVIDTLMKESKFAIDFSRIGVLGASWGSMGAAVLVNNIPDIKAMVSLDGTESHYFGGEDTNIYANNASAEDNDRFIQEIYDSNLLNVSKQKVSYLYFESGDKLNDFVPSREFNYYKKLNSNKYYIRFVNSEHEDFTCIPSILNSSEERIEIYERIQSTTVDFFNHILKEKEFDVSWDNLTKLEETTTEPYDIANLSQEVNQFDELLGRIVDAKTNLPLSYVNVGILNKEVGTVTDTLGYFDLQIEDGFDNDTLRVSRIGYKAKDFLLENILNEADTVKIELVEEISELNEVVVSAKAFKRRTLGNKTESKFLGTGFGYDQLGAEMGIKINVRKNPTFVDAFNFTISHNRLSAKSTFRLNFYEVDKGKPGKNILKDNILVPIEPKQTGKVTIDLKPYDIILKNDVIVTLEWVANKGENKKMRLFFFRWDS